MSRKSRKRARTDRPGRPPDPSAKRHQTTVAGRGYGVEPTPEIIRKRLALTGDRFGKTGLDFPPDVLRAQGLISAEMRDEALRFAMLAWWLYGPPSASCAAIYERMVAEGFGGGDFAPRAEGEDAESDPDQLKRIRSQKARFHRMLEALGAVARGETETALVAGRRVFYRPQRYAQLRGSLFEAVRQLTQFLEMPILVVKLAHEDAPAVEAADWRQMMLITEGLGRLVAARAAEDRHWRDRRRALVRELATGTP